MAVPCASCVIFGKLPNLSVPVKQFLACKTGQTLVLLPSLPIVELYEDLLTISQDLLGYTATGGKSQCLEDFYICCLFASLQIS